MSFQGLRCPIHVSIIHHPASTWLSRRAIILSYFIDVNDAGTVRYGQIESVTPACTQTRNRTRPQLKVARPLVWNLKMARRARYQTEHSRTPLLYAPR